MNLRVSFPREANVEVLPDDKALAKLSVVLALHGMGESGAVFARRLAPVIARNDRAWLIPDGPLPFERRRDRTIGHAWYLFTGDQDALRLSMLESAKYLDAVLAKVPAHKKTALIGFSQGGYLAGVYGALRPERVSHVCCAGGRIKHEFFPAAGTNAPRYLQLHGAKDESVLADHAMSAVEATKQKGYDVASRVFADAGHELTPEMMDAFMEWLKA
ncbi:MAG: alpha/beta fold hydrolase [Planctomycetes bacterium]|nr:alpha/beta fold hydrolase [Planctomycetota bacterium]NUQ34733.1 alpha/beta fold hydrolase [Planctomycetaceae bacterium]